MTIDQAGGERLSLRNKLILWEIGALVLFNYGWMQIRIPPVTGGGIPLGEITLIFALLTINWFYFWKRFASQVFLFPFLIWWCLACFQAFVGLPKYGIWAFRDATQAIESGFLIVGFSVAYSQWQVDRFFRWFYRLLAATVCMGFLYPIHTQLISLPPHISGGGGSTISLFFTFMGTPWVMVVASAALIMSNPPNVYLRTVRTFTATFTLAFTVALYQNRTVYLQTLMVTCLILVFRRRQIGKWSLTIVVILLGVLFLGLTGIEIKGRLNQAISFQFLYDHVLAIGGHQSQDTAGAAAGVGQRIGWWKDILTKWVSSGKNFLIGQGYGFPLIDFQTAEGIKVREPHNSFISVIGRLGLIGIVSWLWMHVILFRAWLRAMKLTLILNKPQWRSGLLILMAYFLAILVAANTEPSFELSFVSITYYFFWGVVLRMRSLMRFELKNQMDRYELYLRQRANEEKRQRSLVVAGAPGS